VSFGYRIYFVDRVRNRVVRWNPDTGETMTIAGGSVAADASQMLQEPYGLALDPTGNLLISDKLNHRICRLRKGRLEAIAMRDTDGHRAVRPDTPALFHPDRVHSPTSMVVEKAGSILCAFFDDQTIYRIHVDGRLELVLGIVPNRPYFHNRPRQHIPPEEIREEPIGSPVALVARSDGTLFFVERRTQVVREFHPKRGLRSLFSLSHMAKWFQQTEAPASGRLDAYHPVSPTSLALDAKENLYLCDNCHGSVLRLEPEKGTFQRVLFVPRGARKVQDTGPVAVAFGPDGTPWVARTDTQELRAHSIAADGTWLPASATLDRIQGEPLRLGSGGMGMIGAS